MAEIIIGEHNWQDYIEDIEVDGEHKARGLTPRDYKSCPVGYLPEVRAFDIPTIPESEWQARLDEKNSKQQHLSQIARNVGNFGSMIPSRDQNGKGYCHTADTEVLTEKGWTPWPEYNFSDLLATVNPVTGLMEFQSPFERHVYEYKGETIHSTNRRLDFGVTPDHRMMVRKWDERGRTLSNQYSFQRAGEIGWYTGLMHAPAGFIGTELKRVSIPGDREYTGDDFVAMLGLIVSDGYAGGSEGSRPGKGTLNHVSFAAFRDDRKTATGILASRVGFREAPSRPGVWSRWDAGALAAWIRSNCYTSSALKAGTKCVPAIIKTLCPRQIELFLSFFGDRSYQDGEEYYYSSSKRMIDDLQELLLRVGRRGTIMSRDPRPAESNPLGIRQNGVQYTLNVATRDNLCLYKKKHIERDDYDGLVYCAAVPNGTLVTRRNGSVLISGNCWAHSTVSAMLLVRALNNEPYADLSAYGIACIIKGFRDQGGWGAESLQFAIKKGCPTSKTWPQKSMARGNDTQATWDEAKKYRVTEWMDGTPRSKAQLVTCLLLNIPVVADYNWWSHSVCAMDLVSLSPFRIRIWNSWSDSWSEQGTGILEGNKAIPDGLVMPRVLTAAA